MRLGNRFVKLTIYGLLGGVLVLTSACAGGVTQSDYDAVKQQLASQEQKAAALEQQLSTRQKEFTDLQQKLSDQDDKAADAAKQAAQPQQQAAQTGVTTLIGVKAVPTSAPPPPPTPLPAGATPPPKPAPPPSIYEPVGPYTVYVEVLATTTASKYGLASTVACTPSSVFKRGQKMVWRFEVIDTATGKRLSDKDEAIVKVKLPHGEDITGRWSQRAGGRVPNAPWMWSANWDIPLDYALGGVDFAIDVTAKDGRTFTWKPPALVGPGSDSRPKIIE